LALKFPAVAEKTANKSRGYFLYRTLYIGHGRLSVCLSLAALPHCCTKPDVTWGNGRGCHLVVHWSVDWTDRQTHRRAWSIYISPRLCLARNVKKTSRTRRGQNCSTKVLRWRIYGRTDVLTDDRRQTWQSQPSNRRRLVSV